MTHAAMTTLRHELLKLRFMLKHGGLTALMPIVREYVIPQQFLDSAKPR